MGDRYDVREELGRGGMGRVLRAFDRELSRDVAIKEIRGVQSVDARARLISEARAMAKLSHPNVVEIFDVQRAGADVLLVMELVHGSTLQEWEQAGPHPWPEVLRRYLAAGRGVAAAHAAGLVHRDFKPANVLLADDVVKVADFGLARFERSFSGAGEPTIEGSLPIDGPASDGLTETGAVLGTPTFMAPEQHLGRRVTAAADQYAFCVALWAALCGDRPFVGEDLIDLVTAKQEGPPAWPDSRPKAIGEALRRGLAPEPEDRWPEMSALLDALARESVGRSRTAVAAIGVVGLVGLVGLVGTTWGSLADAGHVDCRGAARGLAEVWDDAQREQMESAMTGVNVPYARHVWERTRSDLDQYAAQWTAVRTEACEASQRGQQAPETLDARMACLSRARDELAAVTATLADADRKVVDRAHRVVEGLPALSRCSDLEALQSEVEPPREQDAADVAATRVLLATAKVARAAGRRERERELVTEAHEIAAGLSYAPLQAELALADAWVEFGSGDYKAARNAFEAALDQATDTKQRRIVGRAGTMLVYIVGDRLLMPEEALAYRPIAQGAVAGDRAAEASLAAAVGSVLQRLGRDDEALEEHRRALELRAQAYAADHYRVAIERGNVASLLGRMSQFEDAVREQRIVVEKVEQFFGPGHPTTAAMRHNLGIALLRVGDNAGAEVEHRRALEIRVAALGADHPQVGQSHDHLATALSALGKPREAEAEYRESIRIVEQVVGANTASGPRHNLAITLFDQGLFEDAEREQRAAIVAAENTIGADNPELVNMLDLLALIQRELGELDPARTHQRRALDLCERGYGADDPRCAAVLTNLGVTLYLEGKLDDAEAQLRRALALTEAGFGSRHPQVALPLDDLARIAFDRGHVEQAVQQTRRALELTIEPNAPEHPEAVRIRGNLIDRLEGIEGARDEALTLAEDNWRFIEGAAMDRRAHGHHAFRLARLLWRQPGARDRVAELVDVARADFVAVDARGTESLAELDAWLRER